MSVYPIASFEAFSKGLLCLDIVYLMHSDGQAWANSVYSDETPQNTHPEIIDTTSDSKLDFFKFENKYGKELTCTNILGKYGIHHIFFRCPRKTVLRDCGLFLTSFTVITLLGHLISLPYLS